MDIKKTTGLNLSDRELDDASRRLAFFAPNGSKEYVSELYEFLAMQSLASFDPGQLSGVQIYRKLRKLTGIKIEYEEMLGALVRLVKKEEVSCTRDTPYYDDAKFYISPDKRNSIKKQSQNQLDFERNIIDSWKEEISVLYPKEFDSREYNALEEDLREYIYRLVSLNSVESVLLYYSGATDLENVASQLSADSIDQILPKRSDKLNKYRKELLPKFIRTTDDDRKKFIYGLLQATFILHMIQLDPSCSAIVKAQIIGGTLFVDTNFLFRLFGLHSPEMFYATKSLCDLSQELNYKLCITPKTKEEYLYASKEFLKQIQSAPKLPSDLIDAVVDLAEGEDPIIAYYRNIRDTSRSTSGRVYHSPEVYYEYYSEIDSLLEKFNISINTDGYEEILAQENELANESSLLKSFFDDQRLASYQNSYKELNIHVAEHDAFHRLLIYRLRGGYDGSEFYDVPFWFLTCDSKLPVYDRSRRHSEEIRTPFCVLSSQWLQTLRPFSPRVDPASFSDSLSSPLLHAYNPIPNYVITNVAARIQTHKGYSPALGKIAMKRQFLLQFSNAQSEEEKNELINNIFVEYAEEMEHLKEDAERQKNDAERERELARSKADETKYKLDELTKEFDLYKESQNQNNMEREKELKRISSSLDLEREKTKKTEDQLNQAHQTIVVANNNVTNLNQQLETLTNQYGKIKNLIIATTPLIFYGIVLSFVRPWIYGSFWWLALTGILLIFYIGILIMYQPWRKNRLGKFFTFGFPVIIVGTTFLAYDFGNSFLKTIGDISNFAGVVSLFLYLFKLD